MDTFKPQMRDSDGEPSQEVILAVRKRYMQLFSEKAREVCGNYGGDKTNHVIPIDNVPGILEEIDALVMDHLAKENNWPD